MNKTLEYVVSKVFSGRFFSTIAVITTYCVAIITCLYFVKIKELGMETFLGIFSGFSGLAGFIIKAYFDRDDRKQGDKNV